MSALSAAILTILVIFVLNISAESLKNKAEKKMIYWKRDGADDFDDEG